MAQQVTAGRNFAQCLTWRLAWRLAAAVTVGLASLCSAQAGGLVGARAAHAAPGPVAVATSAHLAAGAETAVLSFDLAGVASSDAIQPSAYVLADPDRVIVDLPEISFLADPSAGKPAGRHLRHARAGLVSSYRVGLVAPGRSRVVIDLAGPARIVSASLVAGGGQQRLVVELARTDIASFREAAQAHAIASIVPPEAPRAAPVPGLATIVIDPGHGGPDTGANVNGVIEKDVTLAFAKALAGKLAAHGGFNVVMTRASDVFIPLSERVRIAREARAALMISIHADTLPETADVNGATVYTVSDRASDAYAAKVAATENAADAAGGSEGKADTADVNDILFDLTRQETRAYSHVFARTLVNYWKVAGRLNKNPQRAAGFVVLKAPDVPSVLLELGYLSSPIDSASLTSDAWRETATGRMAEAVEAYFADRNGPAKAAAGEPIPLRQAIAELPAR